MLILVIANDSYDRNDAVGLGDSEARLGQTRASVIATVAGLKQIDEREQGISTELVRLCTGDYQRIIQIRRRRHQARCSTRNKDLRVRPMLCLFFHDDVIADGHAAPEMRAGRDVVLHNYLCCGLAPPRAPGVSRLGVPLKNRGTSPALAGSS